MHQADDGANGQVHDKKLKRQWALVVEKLGQQGAEKNNGLGVTGRNQKGLPPQGDTGPGFGWRIGQSHSLVRRLGRSQRLAAEVDEVAAASQLEGEEQGRQCLQQCAYTHGDQQDENGLTDKICAYGEQRCPPTELQAMLDDQQDIGARGQSCQQISQQEQRPCVQVHTYPL